MNKTIEYQKEFLKENNQLLSIPIKKNILKEILQNDEQDTIITNCITKEVSINLDLIKNPKVLYSIYIMVVEYLKSINIT
ncbi:BA71V-D79L (g7L) [African swine fever virus]|uniref:BA71V-D79L (G7L) n=1 Tax=African swine fever virus TaxID=10497 RepID=A0A0C5AZF9_ASF|nr:BA71V-D79L (g7L) [African swine fever virus]YP_009703002.1 BA71V-D79L (g7L) [African swine fever virus]AJL34117.1 BA71V-D79L (g7L) [African swine fever virus]AJL34282.1 BA71V-D79L (g7L) [African swine fever virus]QRY19130.1 BA71V-D79L (g7L) [African swine fever virus]QXP49887.1 BA71V-D79L (g7L) [African swine fever virus]